LSTALLSAGGTTTAADLRRVRIALQDNDVLVVDRNLLARVTYGLNVFTQPFRDVLGFLLFFDSLANAADSLFRP